MISKYVLAFSYERPCDVVEGGLSKIITRTFTDTSINDLLAKAMKLQHTHATAYDYLFSNAIVIFAITQIDDDYDIAIAPEYYSYINGISIDNQYACRTANVNKIDELRKSLRKREVI